MTLVTPAAGRRWALETHAVGAASPEGGGGPWVSFVSGVGEHP